MPIVEADLLKELVLPIAWNRPLHIGVVVDDRLEEERIVTVFEPGHVAPDVEAPLDEQNPSCLLAIDPGRHRLIFARGYDISPRDCLTGL